MTVEKNENDEIRIDHKLIMTFFPLEINFREIGRGACSYVWVGAKSEGNQRLAALKLHWYVNLFCNIFVLYYLVYAAATFDGTTFS